MPVQSSYNFPLGLDNGPVSITNTASSGPAHAMTLKNGNIETIVRADTEQHMNFFPSLNKPAILSTIDGLLAKAPESPTRVTPIFAQAMVWLQVPYFFGRPSAHPLTASLIRVYFEIFIDLPWPVSNANVNVSFYLFPKLTNHHLSIPVDGAWVIVDGAWPDGQQVADAVGKVAHDAIPTVQKFINAAIAPFSSVNFTSLAVLPGSGTKQILPFIFEDATSDAAISVTL